jgi:hypothetical protein
VLIVSGDHGATADAVVEASPEPGSAGPGFGRWTLRPSPGRGYSGCPSWSRSSTVRSTRCRAPRKTRSRSATVHDHEEPAGQPRHRRRAVRHRRRPCARRAREPGRTGYARGRRIRELVAVLRLGRRAGRVAGLRRRVERRANSRRVVRQRAGPGWQVGPTDAPDIALGGDLFGSGASFGFYGPRADACPTRQAATRAPPRVTRPRLPL